MFIRLTCLLGLFLFGWVSPATCQRVPKKIAEQINSYIVPVDLETGMTGGVPGLSEMVKDKSIVGIGEANHGDHEFDVGFAKMAKQLIKHSGFNVVFLAESNFADTKALNEYVLSGAGDAHTSLQYRFHHPVNDVTREIVELAKWIRGFNKRKPLDEKVWMLGGDLLFPQGHARDALTYCKEHDLVLPDSTRNILSELADLPPDLYISYINHNPLLLVRKKLAPLYVLMNGQDTAGLTLKEKWEYRSILSLKKALSTFYFLHTESLYRNNAQPPRDSAMFEHIRWVRAARPNAKILIKAHNSHIEKRGFYLALNRPHLGWFLDEYYKGEYFAIATDEFKGSYWAGSSGKSVPIPENKRKVSSFVEKVVGLSAGVLPMNATTDLTRFFNKKRRISHANTSADVRLYFIRDFAQAFDALFYVRKATPSKPDIPFMPFFKFSIAWEIPLNKLRKDELKIRLQSSYEFRESSLPNEGLSINLTFYDRERHFLGYQILTVPSGQKIDQLFETPDDARHCSIKILGNNVQRFILKRLAINDKEVNLQHLSEYDAENQLNTANKNEVYLLEERGGELIIRIKDRYL